MIGAACSLIAAAPIKMVILIHHVPHGVIQLARLDININNATQFAVFVLQPAL
jgi:hypothetical protein